MSKFDLERALAGEPVRLRNGTKAFVLEHKMEKNKHQKICGLFFNFKGRALRIEWSLKGKCKRYRGIESEQDIVGMWEKEINTVTVKLPRPLKTVELNQRVYLITEKGICSHIYKETASDLLMLEDARFFATKEDAQAWDDLAKRVREM